eukprot:COSAG04_NODE_32097_length_253_cov_0.662338_2_plen_30_part_01
MIIVARRTNKVLCQFISHEASGDASAGRAH